MEYTTRSDFEAYVEGWVTEDTDALDRLLERAERDVDGILGDWPTLNSGLKFDPAETDEDADGYLDAPSKAALSRAVCAQAEYRFHMGEDFMVKAQHQFVAGPDFQQRGQLPHIGPKVLRELSGFGLVRVLA